MEQIKNEKTFFHVFPTLKVEEEFKAVIFNMLGMDFYKLSPDEQKTFKKVLSKSPAIKNSPVNFRRKRK